MSAYNPRSMEAWYGLDPDAMAARQRRIIRVIADGMEAGRHGATTYEIEVATGMRHQSCSAAVSLMWHGKRWIRPSGRTRLTDTGRRANVMEIGDPEAPDAPRQPEIGGKDGPAPVEPAPRQERFPI